MTPGARLGPYEIVSALGAGGMGEVYRARDPKLHREVAIKVLPEAFADDPGRLARLQREAHVLAALNHPHIAAIYGLEEPAGSTPAFLVMELVEGEDLSQRIERGALPLDEALPIAKQIAEALEAAHEQGIIHRDLKPANIKVRPDGTVKVLDFGLAKAMAPAGSAPNVSQSPTITTPAMMTGVGIILGTAAYMSPEQAKGRNVDKRSDIWAFGCVLYEMLTGVRAFKGEDVADTLAAVLRAEPDWNAFSSDVPTAIRVLIRRCLEKDRRKRIADIAAALVLIEEAPSLSGRQDSATSTHGRPWLIGAGVCLAAGLVIAAAAWWLTRPVAPPVVRMAITTSAPAALALQGGDRDIAITPDGTRVVYRGNNQLLVRALDQFEPTVLSGLGMPQGVFISPDGQRVGFFDGTNSLKKVAITGGPPVTVCAFQGLPRGASWSDDGTIIFATNAGATGLQRVSAGGGEPTVLTKPDRARGEADHIWPELLPEGQAVLFTITPLIGGLDNAQIAVLDLRTGTTKVLFGGGSHAHYVSTGHLVYGVAGTLRAVAFDIRRLEVVGTPTLVLEGIVTTGAGAADVALAANGSLVYVPGGAGGGGRETVVSVDRQGRASPLPGLSPGAYRDVRISPDGMRVALSIRGDVWIYSFARAALSKLTTDPAADYSPLWTPDGERVIFASRRAGFPELFSRRADGTGSDERLVTRAKDLTDLFATGWSNDRQQILVTEVPQNLQCVIAQIATETPAVVKALLKGESCNARAVVSPDGRWLAYTSGAAPGSDIYVERYPQLGNRQQISSGGGTIPVWSPNGRELFFITNNRQMHVVTVQSGTAFVASQPRVLFEFPMLEIQGGARPYDITPDGRFLIVRSSQSDSGDTRPSNIIVVQNWFEELKRLVPVN